MNLIERLDEGRRRFNVLEQATCDPEPLVRRAEAALAGNWALLDGVSRSG